MLQHDMTLYLGEGQTKERLKQFGWNLREKAKPMPPVEECPSSSKHVPYESHYMEL